MLGYSLRQVQYRKQENCFGTAAVVGDLSFGKGIIVKVLSLTFTHSLQPQIPLVSNECHVQTPLCQCVPLISLDVAYSYMIRPHDSSLRTF